MLLVQSELDKIKSAWLNGNTTPCSWAISSLGKYVDSLQKGETLHIESSKLSFDRLEHFIDWKSKESILQDVPIFYRWPTDQHLSIINQQLHFFPYRNLWVKKPYENLEYYIWLFSNEKHSFKIDFHIVHHTSIDLSSVLSFKNARFSLLSSSFISKLVHKEKQSHQTFALQLLLDQAQYVIVAESLNVY